MRNCSTLTSSGLYKIARYSISIFLITLLTNDVSAQKISLGVTYTDSDAYFLRSVPGITIGYDHQIWKMFFFLYGNAAKHKHSFAEYSSMYQSMKSGYGEVFKGNINTGVALYLLQSENYGISIGTFLGMNYIHRIENITNVYADRFGNCDISHEKIDSWDKNRWGYGIFLDIEVRQFLVQQLGLFTRIEWGYTRLMDGPIPRGLPFTVYGYNNVCFSIGMNYDLKRKD